LDQLLAVIHRDGGQYTVLAGYADSVEDAMSRYHILRRKKESLLMRLKQLSGDVDE
jgi:hypothetical protein